MMKDHFERIAERIAAALALSPGEHVLVSGGAHQFDLLARIAVHVARAGAHPRVAVSSDEMSVRLATEVDERYAAAPPTPHDKYMAGLYDAAIAIDPVLDESAYAAIPPERRRLGAKSGRILGDIARSARRRSIFMGWPSPVKAASCGMPVETFERLFLDALLADPGRMGRLSAPLAARLRKGGRARITSRKGSDLSFTLDPARRVMIDAGCFDAAMVDAGDITKNLPCGEVYTTPVETTVEGAALFDLAFVEGEPIRDLRLVFRAGRLAGATAASGIEAFRKRYDAAIGDRDRLGELGIGVNPALASPIGHTLLDEKIHGSVHLALGENRMYGGLNESSLHWDLVMLSPTLAIDGDIAIADGRFPDEEPSA